MAIIDATHDVGWIPDRERIAIAKGARPVPMDGTVAGPTTSATKIVARPLEDVSARVSANGIGRALAYAALAFVMWKAIK